MGEVMQLRPISRPTPAGQSPPVPGRPRQPDGSSLFLVPRDYVRIIGIIATIEHVVT